jgi:hypothetical protein
MLDITRARFKRKDFFIFIAPAYGEETGIDGKLKQRLPIKIRTEDRVKAVGGCEIHVKVLNCPHSAVRYRVFVNRFINFLNLRRCGFD